MNDPLIHLDPLPLAQLNIVLEALKEVKLGIAYEVFTKLYTQAQQQLAEQNTPPAA